MKDAKIITVDLKDRSYPVFIGTNIYQNIKDKLLQLDVNKQVAIITTPPVAKHYLKNLLNIFDHSWQVIYYNVPDGENSKSIEMCQALYSWLIENNFERKSTIIALGGGVIGDLAGFVAATFLRGVNLVHLPTTLLSQVDSSIGGKVGVNHPSGKNLIGAFYQPKFVMVDVSKLTTLPEDEFICGMGEVIKYGLIYDQDLFRKIDEKLDHINTNNLELLEEIISSCVKIKAEIVSKDEKESGLRSILNFGHTFGHALEVFYHYGGLKHGQAVLLGMKCANYVSCKLNLMAPELANKIDRVIDRMNIRLPDNGKTIDKETLLSYMRKDKKVQEGSIKLILLKSIAQPVQLKVDDEKLLMESFQSIL
jgi:3-dehydroquinate synthase